MALRSEGTLMRILVVGAGRTLGARIALGLAGQGHDVVATRRSSRDWDAELSAAGCQLETLDLVDLDALRGLAEGADRAVITPILTVSASAIAALAAAGIGRGVTFSSHNVTVVGDDPVYDALRRAEAEVSAAAPGWTILRPTMIYGGGDQNLSKLMGWLAKSPIAPFPGSGKALQHPIHVEDLAEIAASLALSDTSPMGPVSVGGPDTVSYRALVDLAKSAIGSRALVIGCPVPILSALARLARLVGVDLASPSQLARIDKDKHVSGDTPLPEGVAPQIDLRTGLAKLASELGLTPPDH
ncbi:MAG: NAD(P)H-binding protein [Pseudomonadota bacterium]